MALPLRKRFDCAPSNAAAARTFVTNALAGLHLDVGTAELLVSELATNTIRHARTPFVVSLSETADGVRIEVSDESRVMPSPLATPDEGGYGLAILDALAEWWGCEPTDCGKAVWFEVPLIGMAPGDERRPPAEPVPAGSGSEPTYSIGAVSQLVGVGTSTLRAWEARYGVVVPFRSSGGQRLYSRNQVDHLRFVLAQINEGMRAAEAHRLLEQRMESVAYFPATAGASMLILLAERDHYAAELCEYFLRTEGYDVRIALDGEEGQRLTQQEHLDLAIVELLLPDGSARELCRQLAGEGVPVLAVSSLELRDAALEAGASAFLVKPLSPLQLVSAVRDLLGTSSMSRATAQKGSLDDAHH